MLPTKFYQNQIFFPLESWITVMCEKLFIQNDDLPKRMLKQILSINVGIRERYSYSCLKNEMRKTSWGLFLLFRTTKRRKKQQLRHPPGFGPNSRSRWMSFWCSCQSWYLWPLLYEAFFYGGDFGMATCKVRFPFFFVGWRFFRKCL